MMLANTNPYTLLADLILAVHFAFVTFVVAGLVLIWVGFFLHWPFVRDWRFRIAHLLAMAFVLGESLTGFICPLTTWENQLRLRGGGERTYAGSFLQHWLGRILFFDLSERTFTIIYALFFILLVLTFIVVRPRRQKPQAEP